MYQKHLCYRYTIGQKLGKEKMVQWTTPFMIGITQMISNSEIPPPSSGYGISFPNQPFARVRDHDSLLQVLEACVLPITLYPHLFFNNSRLNKKLTSRLLILTGFLCHLFYCFDQLVNFFFSHEVGFRIELN